MTHKAWLQEARAPEDNDVLRKRDSATSTMIPIANPHVAALLEEYSRPERRPEFEAFGSFTSFGSSVG